MITLHNQDTIAAQATASGEGGIAIVLSLEIVNSTIGTIQTRHSVVNLILTCTCCKLSSADRELEVDLTTANRIGSVEVLLARC